MNLKLVIFDMDGLMYDTEQIGMDCLINAAQKFGYVIDQEFGLSSIGKIGRASCRERVSSPV